jgi:hypothetical protein
MKKAIVSTFVVLLSCITMAVQAATIGLGGGTPPAGTTVTIDASNNIHVSSSGSIYRIDFYRQTAPTFYSIVGPMTGSYTFYADNAYIVSIGWQLPYYPYNASAQYYITY